MESTSWHKQSPGQPIFEDMIWSKPQTKARAGKLLIIGGNLHGFNAPAEAYALANQAGVGTSRVILPDKLRKTVEKLFPEAEYAPSTPSGSFARKALAEWLDAATWADGVLLAGDMGHNSETAITVESFLTDFSSQITVTGDALDYCLSSPGKCLERTKTTLIVEMQHLQKLAAAQKVTYAFTHDMNLNRLVENLADFSKQVSPGLVLSHAGNMIVAVNGQISTTRNEDKHNRKTELAAKSAVWLLQNPEKTFEALTTAMVQ